MERCTVTTDEELASLHREMEKEAEAQRDQPASLYEKVQKKVDAKQKELLMREEQYMMDKLEDLILEEMTPYVIDKQKYQPQDDTTTRDRKDEPGTENIKKGDKQTYQPQDDTATRDRKDEPRTESTRKGDKISTTEGVVQVTT